MEMPILVARQLLLFAHLIGFALVFNAIIRQDWALLTATRLDAAALRRTERVTMALLAFLWATGAALIVLDLGTDPVALAGKPKLLTKIGVVSVLTLNGVLLHWIAFPLLTKPQAAPGRAAAICAALGAVSLVSWTYAAFVGCARLIASRLTLRDFLDLYALALALGLIVALVFVRPRIARLLTASPAAA